MVNRKNTKVTLQDFDIFDRRAAEGLAVASAIDQAKPIPYSVTIEADIEDFMGTLTPKRFEILRLSRTGNHSISELAVAAHRDPSAVSKDVAKLVDLGLVSVVIESNAGHGIKKIVRPVAENIQISAAIF